MIYFYLWVLFLVGILAALPIVAYMEKPKREKTPKTEPAEEGAAAVGADEKAMEPAGDGFEDFGQPVPAGGDDFAAFDDFK